MDHHLRLSIALVASLALWTPTILACLRGDIDLAAAALRYVIAFAGCHVAVSGIGHLVTTYAGGAGASEAEDDAAVPAVERGSS